MNHFLIYIFRFYSKVPSPAPLWIVELFPQKKKTNGRGQKSESGVNVKVGGRGRVIATVRVMVMFRR